MCTEIFVIAIHFGTDFVRSIGTHASNGELAEFAVAPQQRGGRGLYVYGHPRAYRFASIRSTSSRATHRTGTDDLRRTVDQEIDGDTHEINVTGTEDVFHANCESYRTASSEQQNWTSAPDLGQAAPSERRRGVAVHARLLGSTALCRRRAHDACPSAGADPERATARVRRGAREAPRHHQGESRQDRV
ncbi:hypothetical protein [Sorangium cellulosum]|uniref:hypothetical protein n=1 Tax=Sorangium cellulosum TaxID=56 RepID=UPI0013EBBD47|nr:hypothetical protein [Sorangium cellulosum]